MKILQKIWPGLIMIVVFAALMYNMINHNRKEKLLQNSKTTIGILISQYSEGKSASGTFKFHTSSKIIEFRQIGDFSSLQKGDTVLIKYAIDDPNIAVVENRFFMKKYKHLKN